MSSISEKYLYTANPADIKSAFEDYENSIENIDEADGYLMNDNFEEYESCYKKAA